MGLLLLVFLLPLFLSGEEFVVFFLLFSIYEKRGIFLTCSTNLREDVVGAKGGEWEGEVVFSTVR